MISRCLCFVFSQQDAASNSKDSQVSPSKACNDALVSCLSLCSAKSTCSPMTSQRASAYRKLGWQILLTKFTPLRFKGDSSKKYRADVRAEREKKKTNGLGSLTLRLKTGSADTAPVDSKNNIKINQCQVKLFIAQVKICIESRSLLANRLLH